MVALTRQNKARAIVPKEWKVAPCLTPEEKTKHITLMICVNANGYHLPSTVILPDLQNLPTGMNVIIDELAWTSSDSGWVTDGIYDKWVESIFIPFVTSLRIIHHKPNAPVLLWMDGHGSRSSATSINLLKASNITVIIIPAHTSHITQPLDCGVNRAFKQWLKKHYIAPTSTSLPVVRESLMSAAATAQYHAVAKNIIESSFAKAGLFPWNPDVILNDPTKVNTSEPEHNPRAPVRQSARSISGQILVSPNLVAHSLVQAIPTVSTSL